MRETMKNLIKNTITSIGIALTVFCVTGMVFDIAYDGNFCLDNYQFSKTVNAIPMLVIVFLIKFFIVSLIFVLL